MGRLAMATEVVCWIAQAPWEAKATADDLSEAVDGA